MDGAGYSKTPLATKLGMKEHSTVAMFGYDLRLFEDPLPITETGTIAPFDVVLSFVMTIDQLASGLPGWAALLVPNGGLWICWPKKTARRKPQFAAVDMTEDAVREHALPMNLVDNKVFAIDNDWSGLRLVWRVAHRTKVGS